MTLRPSANHKDGQTQAAPSNSTTWGLFGGRRRVSVRSRLTGLNMVVLALVLVCMAVALRYTVEINLKAALDRDMSATTQMALQRW